MNGALLVKLGWRLLIDDEAYGSKFLHRKYFGNNSSLGALSGKVDVLSV